MNMGYALVRLVDGAIVGRASMLPCRFSIEGLGVVDFDKPGQIAPDANFPTHKFCLCVADDIPEGKVAVGRSEQFVDPEVVVTHQLADFVPPVPEQISDRQFAHALRIQGTITQEEAMAFVQTGTIPAALQAVINQLPMGVRPDAELLLAGATVFNRNHSMVEALRQGLGWSAEDVDDLWRLAEQL